MLSCCIWARVLYCSSDRKSPSMTLPSFLVHVWPKRSNQVGGRSHYIWSYYHKYDVIISLPAKVLQGENLHSNKKGLLARWREWQIQPRCKGEITTKATCISANCCSIYCMCVQLLCKVLAECCCVRLWGLCTLCVSRRRSVYCPTHRLDLAVRGLLFGQHNMNYSDASNISHTETEP